MKVKNYKIWRYCRCKDGGEESIIYVPEGVKFYCFNKKNSIENFEHFKKQGLNPIYPNQTWVAVLPWSEEIEKMSHSIHWKFTDENKNIMMEDDYTYTQSLSLHSYNLNDNYMIWYLEQIYPLTKDFPETEELPKFEPQYIKVRDMDGVKLDSRHTLSHLSHIFEKELTDDQFNEVYPINEYYRLESLKYGGFVATRVVVRDHEVRGNKRLMIEHNDYPLEIMKGFPCCPGKERVEASTKEEFDKSVKLVLEKSGLII